MLRANRYRDLGERLAPDYRRGRRDRLLGDIVLCLRAKRAFVPNDGSKGVCAMVSGARLIDKTALAKNDFRPILLLRGCCPSIRIATVFEMPGQKCLRVRQQIALKIGR